MLSAYKGGRNEKLLSAQWESDIYICSKCPAFCEVFPVSGFSEYTYGTFELCA